MHICAGTFPCLGECRLQAMYEYIHAHTCTHTRTHECNVTESGSGPLSKYMYHWWLLFGFGLTRDMLSGNHIAGLSSSF